MALGAASAKRQGRYFAQHTDSVDPQGRPMRSLCDSAAEPLRMAAVLAMASPEEMQLWEDLSLDYSSKDGRPELREEVAKQYGEGIGAADVTVVVPEEGIFLAMAAALPPSATGVAQQHVICMSPAFQSLHEHAESTGCEVDFWEPRLLPETGRVAADGEGWCPPPPQLVSLSVTSDS